MVAFCQLCFLKKWWWWWWIDDDVYVRTMWIADFFQWWCRLEFKRRQWLNSDDTFLQRAFCFDDIFFIGRERHFDSTAKQCSVRDWLRRSLCVLVCCLCEFSSLLCSSELCIVYYVSGKDSISPGWAERPGESEMWSGAENQNAGVCTEAGKVCQPVDNCYISGPDRSVGFVCLDDNVSSEVMFCICLFFSLLVAGLLKKGFWWIFNEVLMAVFYLCVCQQIHVVFVDANIIDWNMEPNLSKEIWFLQSLKRS